MTPTMEAMRLHAPREALRREVLGVPAPGPGEVLLAVRACGVCRTDLHVFDGELEGARLPLVPGHEIVGEVAARGEGAQRFALGDRVGVPWLAWTCGECAFCRSGRENLCDGARFTGLHRDGGYAGYTVADERFCLAIPPEYGDAEAAPLLCAGLIGYRALAMAGDARRLGLYGFGAAAHLIAQVAVHQGREVFAFTRPGDAAGQAFARKLGCAWAGDSTARPPELLDAALLFAPVGALVPAALAASRKGAVVVCAGIHMSDIPAFPYALLWGERSVRSVANLTRADGAAFLRAASEARVRPAVRTYPLEQANAALEDLRRGALEGAAVLLP
jgi:propanol-preferring alcohol dehydrogenase